EITTIATNHPKRIRHSADGAKLLSSNDKSGFTYRGRFDEARQVFGVGAVVTQKAHSALRWLINRQGGRTTYEDAVYLAWETGGKGIPDPFSDTGALFGIAGNGRDSATERYRGDIGQHFALRLNKMISGYRTELGDCDEITVMGLDS